MSTTATHWLEQYRRAWEERDPELAAAIFTPDAVYQEKPHSEPLRGSAAIHDYWASVTATQNDVKVTYGTPISSGNVTVVEWWVNMTNGGEDVSLAGSFHLNFAADGRCAELREYWHFAEGHFSPGTTWGR